MSVSKKMLQAAAGQAGGEALAIEDVFSTYLYTGNGSTQTITNGIDLAGEGGLVWTKNRNQPRNHNLVDTERGVGLRIKSNATDAEYNEVNGVTSFNSDGYSLSTASDYNANNDTYASWTFRKAPRFFDVVTYTGDGVAGREIAHNLGVEPGCIIIKRTNASADWIVGHRSIPVAGGAPSSWQMRLVLNATAAAAAAYGAFFPSDPTSSFFTIGNITNVNASGGTYVAYLFAHDPLGPSGDGSDGMISCGSYTGNGSTDGPEIDLGWEPQWLMVKSATVARSWYIIDTMRGMPVRTTTGDQVLEANSAGAEYSNNAIDPTPTGFKLTGTTFNGYNASGETYIYMAIRRGPMRAPESGTEVFDVNTWVGDGAASRLIATSTDVSDLVIARDQYNTSTRNIVVYDRLRGDGRSLETNTTDAESVPSGADNDLSFDTNGGFLVHSAAWNAYLNYSSYNALGWSFRRAPGFFDVVAYTGNGVAGRTVSHNLGVAPEMMIVKNRQRTVGWQVYQKDLGYTYRLLLNSSDPVSLPSETAYWSADPTDTVFYVGFRSEVNYSSENHIAYLFATLPGVSKVGSYTGNGTSQTIDCGFTSGARFILIKRTDSTGDWYVWDTERGIVTGNDPHLSLNTTAAEVTSDDSIDPDSSGFIVNQVAATNINVSAASYIFYAIA